MHATWHKKIQPTPIYLNTAGSIAPSLSNAVLAAMSWPVFGRQSSATQQKFMQVSLRYCPWTFCLTGILHLDLVAVGLRMGLSLKISILK